MSWADAVKKEYADYWKPKSHEAKDVITRMETKQKTKEHKDLKEYFVELKRRRLDYERELHSKD